MDEATQELVRDWLTRASHDLRSSRVLAALEEPLLDNSHLPLPAGGGEVGQGMAASERRSFPQDS